ncbi:MAG: DUF4249 domain-containing protein [Tannerellaceae bacterium]|jgi:hypothetical protein|nr:DUF4249 domain-containing protein [Tannerellaceae bacterium]
MEAYKYFLLLPGLFLTACIDPFEMKEAESFGGILVVDGTVSSGLTVVNLSRSAAMGEEIDDVGVVDGATIFVECSDGSFSAASVYVGGGRYEIEAGVLDTARQYRLRISLDGLEYASAFLTPLVTPAIDSLSVSKHGRGEPVYINVSTHKDGNEVSYYRWKYTERWEFKAELFASAGYHDMASFWTFIAYHRNTSRNTYYCWGADSTYIAGQSANLAGNAIVNRKLMEIDPSGDKLSILYYVSVEQQLIREDAHIYLVNRIKNATQVGGLFGHIPAEMDGNIKCLNDPQLPVIGHVEVSTPTYAELFIPEREGGLYEPPVGDCGDMVMFNYTRYDLGASYIYSFIVGSEERDGGVVGGTIISLAPRRCVDCTMRGTKNKPSFWPTDPL